MRNDHGQARARMDRLFRDDPDFDALLTQLVERTANPVTAAERAIATALQSLADRDNRVEYRG